MQTYVVLKTAADELEVKQSCCSSACVPSDAREKLTKSIRIAPGLRLGREGAPSWVGWSSHT